MNARQEYIQIIRQAKSENREKGKGVYYEAHHILPKAKTLFPLWKNRKSNIVLLTAQEHFRCHELLVVIYGYRMAFALHKMQYGTNQKKYKITPKQFEELRKIYANASSKLHKHKIVSEETKQKIKEGRKRFFENGGITWNKGETKETSDGLKRSALSASIRKKGKSWEDEFGKEISDKLKQQVSKRNKENQNHIFRKGFKGEENGMYGISVYENWVKKWGKEKADLKMQEYHETMSKATKGEKNGAFGKRWWNNGVKCIFTEICPDGWKAGVIRKPRKKKTDDEGRGLI
jgi:hypothetical protein